MFLQYFQWTFAYVIRLAVLSCQSSIVVTGVPTKSYRLPTEWIQPGTVVVNVASYKNVDEEALLRIPGVLYVPQVGKVTVAMLERNLIRLYDQFHHHANNVAAVSSQLQKTSWWASITSSPSNTIIPLYTAAAVTILIALQISKRN